MRFIPTLIFSLFLISCADEEGRCPDGCGADEVCIEDGRCEPTCEEDYQCAPGYFCGDPMLDESPTCLPRSTFEKYGDRWAEGPHTILLSDRSAQVASCSTDTEGSDIVYVKLENGSGVELGWANLITRLPTNIGPIGDFTGENLDGQAPTFEGECPSIFDPEHIMSIGCARAIALEFLDTEGLPIRLENGMELLVFEHGAQCTSVGTEDLFVVNVCQDAYALADGETGSCAGSNLTPTPVSGEVRIRVRL